MTSEPFEFGDEWDLVTDIVVVGTGAAGGAAAATAAASGASVIVLEKAAFVGGTTGRSGGVMWVPNNPVMQRMGLPDERADALRYMARTAYPTRYRGDHATLGLPARQHAVLAAFYDHGAQAIDHLVSIGAVEVEHVPYPDYYADLPEDTAPFGRVMAPRFPDGWTRGISPTGGQILADGLLDAAQRDGAQVRLEHEVRHVLRDDEGRVIGVECRAGTRTVIIGARRGVIFGSGGFIHDRDLRFAYLRGPVLGSAASETATGDFVRIGMEVGAELGNMSHAWWDQVAVEHAVTVPSTLKDVYIPFGDSMLMVNKRGVRVVNEKAVYNDRGTVHFAWDPSRYEYPNLLLFMIWDQAVMDDPEPSRFRWPVPLPGEPLPGFIASADTLEALADDLRRRLTVLEQHTAGATLADDFDANLAAAIERFNAAAREGVDREFERGRSQIERTWAGRPREGLASGCLAPLRAEGPYYALIVGPGALDTKGGPTIDAHARIQSLDGQPIVGLYGAGNCIAAPSGQAYWGPGGTIGPAMVFGYIAAQHALQEATS
jgi:succinate dehydrogenase/fumarate reductase flavoprotein subunit